METSIQPVPIYKHLGGSAYNILIITYNFIYGIIVPLDKYNIIAGYNAFVPTPSRPETTTKIRIFLSNTQIDSMEGGGYQPSNKYFKTQLKKPFGGIH